MWDPFQYLELCQEAAHLLSWLQVYEMGEAAAQQQWQQRLLYTDTGSIAWTGTNTSLAVNQVSSMHQLQLGPTQWRRHWLLLSRACFISA
jgi:hypothetical protein